jgi:Fe-S-cluster containining protein
MEIMYPTNLDGTGANIPAACFRCGECCTRHQALVEEKEIQQIADYLGISLEDLKTEYTDPRWPIPGKFLLRHRDNGGCVFLAKQGKESLCSIHEVKPTPCRDWTPALSRKECSCGIGRIWGLEVSAKGEICGAEHDKREFFDYLRSISA